MQRKCDHCGRSILQGVEPVEGDQGEYCSDMCRFDDEILDVEYGDVPRRRRYP